MIRYLAVLALLCIGCTGIPSGLKPVENFDVRRYTGTGYEIARLPTSVEKGLEQISAQYTPRDEGGIDVLNRGYDPAKQKWNEARGKAYFVRTPDVGRLKVSFFWPFYGAYNIIALDSEYRWSLICGPDRSYLWILAREKSLDRATLDRLIAQAKSMGFATDKLIYVKHV